MEAFKYLNKVYYKKILYTIVVLITLIIFTLSVVLYFNFENIITSETTIFIKDNLSKVSYSSTFMSESANILLTQLYKDPLIQNFFYNITSDELSLYLSNMRLRSFRNLVPYVKSIYIYNGSTKKIYYDTAIADTNGNEIKSFFDSDILSIVKDTQRGLPNTAIPRVVKANTTFDSNYNVYSFILYEMPIKHSDNDNFIVVNISEDWVKKMINSLDSKQQGEIFIINEKGQMVSSTKNTPILTDISDKNFVKKILDSKTTSGYFVDNVDGVKSLITYVSSDDTKTDWKFLHILPYNSITESADSLKFKTIIISGIIILLGLAISLYSSLKLYKPLDVVLESLEKLKIESRKAKNVVKQNFLKTLIRSEFPQNHKLDECDLNFDLSQPFLVIVLMIDHYSDFYSKYGYDDRSLFKFAIMNITDELCSVDFKSECVDMDSDHIVLLLNVSTDFDFNEKLSELINQIQTVIKSNLGLSLSAILNTNPGNLDSVRSIYTELTNFSYMRMFFGHGCLIHSNLIELKDSSEFVYPEQKEKALTNSLMLRNIDKAKDTFNEIITSTEGFSSVIISMVTFRLTLAINATIDNIKKGKDITITYSYNEFTSKLSHLETLDEIRNHFYSIFEYVNNILEDIKTSGHDYLANKVAKIIESNFSDQNMCTDSIASTLGMSGDYIGRLFKASKAISIAEYINRVRIEKAKELLSNSNKPINDIMDEIGFQNNSYFYILFKKQNGITPAEYRQRSRDS